MQELFYSGRVVDIVIALMLVETAALIGYFKATGQGIEPKHVLSNVLAGACLFVAVRMALTGAAWHWIAVSLIAALIAHLIDLRSRWRRH